MNYFSKIRTELMRYDARREAVIKASREILKNAKTVIFLCHEGKIGEALTLLNNVSKQIQKSEKVFFRPLTPRGARFALYQEGSWVSAIEEYFEAWLVVNYIKTGRIVPPKVSGADAETHVGALSDFTGELLRRTVSFGSKKDKGEIERIRKAVASVIAFLLPMHLTGSSRQKFDAAKRNLKRIEEILYDVSIRS